jgi:curved DNA-binding protein CbpA
MPADYYQILGISREANVDQIKQAYRSKAKLYHPDINKAPNAKIIFQMINEAYQVLINPEKKKWYDFKLQYPSTTGMRPQAERRRTQTYDSYYKAYTRQQQEKQKEKEFVRYRKTALDNFLFYFLIVAGASAIIFSINDLVYNTYSSKNASGLIFGVWFLLILIWGWNLLSSKK